MQFGRYCLVHEFHEKSWQHVLAAVYQLSSPAEAKGEGEVKFGLHHHPVLCCCHFLLLAGVHALQAISAVLPDDDADDEQHAFATEHRDTAAMGQAAAANPSQQADPNRQISHLLLLANAAANLPCIAVSKCVQLQQPLQQQQRQGGWCGVGFSGLPGLHVQLQQQVLQAVKHAGHLLRVSWQGQVLWCVTCTPCVCHAHAMNL